MSEFTQYNSVTHPKILCLGDWNNLLGHGLVKPYSYIIRKNGSYYEAINGSTGIISYGGSANVGGATGTLASSVLQASINAMYASGGTITFSADTFTFATQISIPDGTYSLRFIGAGGWAASANVKGTVFNSTVTGSALFQQAYTQNHRASYGLELRDILFVGDESAGSCALHLTNSTTGAISHCMFLRFDIHIIIDMNHAAIVEGGGGNYALIVAEMPGLFTIHDNIFSEHQTCATKFDNVTQIKIHGNEYESWGPFLRQIHIINSNGINIFGNRFTGNDGTVQQLEVIKIDTDECIYCNQIHISDNIAYMGNGGVIFPFIEMTNTFGDAHVCNNIVSRNNNLVLDYAPSLAQILANDMYELPATPATLGGIDVHDHIRTLNDTENLKDFTSEFANNTTYQNLWSPLQLYFLFNTIKATSGVVIYMGKTSGAGLIALHQYANSTAEVVDGDVMSFMIDVPVGWYFKYVVSGNTALGSIYGVYH
jgi:hypothetical protein